MDLIKNSFLEAQQVLEAFISDEKNLGQVKNAGDLLVDMFRQGGKVFSCGNGGSLCDAMHFAEELTGRFRHERAALPAIAIADPSHFTCVSNDMSFDSVFSKYLEALGDRGDVLLAISTSGNSSNILQAIDTAHVKGMKVIGLTGKTGGEMKEKCDITIVVPWNKFNDPIARLMGLRYKSHPWHGLEVGDDAPEVVTAFIEMVPTDTVKYELDKVSGYIKIDRPQKYSNVVPALYGFIPQSYCGGLVAEYAMQQTQRTDIQGDCDPLDICVLTERTISHGDIIARVRPIGGFRMLDGNEADDKIIAVLKHDATYNVYNDISELPHIVVDRLKHYFLTYKDMPGEEGQRKVEITHVYGREEAYEVIRRSLEDYKNHFEGLEDILSRV